jgi:hypothetical protein
MYTKFLLVNLNGRDLGNVVVDGRIILKRYGTVVPVLKHHAMKTCE